MKRILLAGLLILFSTLGITQSNPFTNPSFEQKHSAGFCDQPDDWKIKDGASGYSELGLLCVQENDVTDGNRSLQLSGSGSNDKQNRAAAIQTVNLAGVDTVAFDLIGPGNGNPNNATVNVYVDGNLVKACGHVGNNRQKVCKVPVAKFAGLHDFEIRFLQRRGNNLGNAAIDHVRLVDPCADAGSAPTFTLNGPDTVTADLVNSFSIQKSPASEFAKYYWYQGNQLLSLNASLKHVFEQAGNQQLQVMADHCFGSDTLTHNVWVEVPGNAPVADFTASHDTLEASDTVTFSNASENHPYAYEWEITPGNSDPADLNYAYVNGTNAQSAEPEVAFLKTGTYDVCLTATNRNGNDEECKNALITVEQNYTRHGDTLRLKDAHEVLWLEHGEHYSWATLPSDTHRYRKIYMYYNLSCAPPNCNDWDYTTKMEVLMPTGEWDTTVTEVPNFRVDDSIQQQLAISWDTTYNYYFNPTTQAVDSVPHAPRRVTVFDDPQRPLRTTNEHLVFPGNYYRYEYDTAGNKVDSTQIEADTIWQLDITELEEIDQATTPIEISRVSTPYAGQYPTSWSRSWKIDVTDYASILKNGIRIRDYYRGNNSTGNFKINVGFEFIEGIPPRDNVDVQAIYESPGTGFYYGYPNNPIENHLVPKERQLPQNAENSKLRVWVNGHGFGGNQNCAEFCAKNFFLKIDGNQQFTQRIWRDNCGMNALYPQAGTWIYNRTNWCPGSPVTPYDFETTSLLDGGDNATFDMDFEPFTYNQGGTPSRWVLTTQLLSFSEPNFAHDAAIDQIIAPNDHWYYNRYNPVCARPTIRIRNTGSETLTSVKIRYGVKSGFKRTYEWTGELAFEETTEVTLPGHNFGQWSGEDIFVAEVLQPNGQQDEYAPNNRHESTFDRVPQYNDDLVIWVKTNKAGGENWYEVIDANGQQVHKRESLPSEATIEDTLSLDEGCYRFIFHDDDEDGLSFFANNDGNGLLRLYNGNTIAKLFDPNFGTQISHAFTVGFGMRTNDRLVDYRLDVYPNPASKQVFVDIGGLPDKELDISVMNTNGQAIYQKSLDKGHGNMESIDVQEWSSGIYLVKVRIGDKEEVVRRFMKE